MMMKKLLRFCSRQLHTIVSKDIIKPSSPTPLNLKTYNLSLLDQVAMNAYMPVVIFYPSSGNIYRSPNNTNLELKNSLSQTLTQYYPFAGRMSKTCPTFVDCNDDGVEFIEAYNDGLLYDFLKHSEHQDFDQLFPDDLIWYNSFPKACDDEKYSSPLKIQVNHFGCGGVAVAVSLSHKIADGCSLLNFINHWATMTRTGTSCSAGQDSSRIKPHFISYQTRNRNVANNLPYTPHGRDYVARSFLFPNEKLIRLKAKVEAMAAKSGQLITNLTRIEVLTWLLHTRIMATMTSNTGTLNKIGMCQVICMRSNLVEALPETSVGNLCLMTEIPTTNQNELMPNTFIHELRIRKTEIRSIRNLETAIEIVAETCSETGILEALERLDEYYTYSNLYGLPTYGIDFNYRRSSKESDYSDGNSECRWH